MNREQRRREKFAKKPTPQQFYRQAMQDLLRQKAELDALAAELDAEWASRWCRCGHERTLHGPGTYGCAMDDGCPMFQPDTDATS